MSLYDAPPFTIYICGLGRAAEGLRSPKMGYGPVHLRSGPAGCTSRDYTNFAFTPVYICRVARGHHYTVNLLFVVVYVSGAEGGKAGSCPDVVPAHHES